ncbi:MAG TPA: M20 family metallopeptidase [Fibrobacteria bacterium]|nr:M20 family metallopeptidase [Fibrobacteria bacterium]
MTTVDPGVVQRSVEIRRRIHGHPELSGREWKTRDLVVAELSAAGHEPRVFAGSAAVAALWPGREGGSCVALRADMDALPLEETSGVPWASCVHGSMHACGHDGHTSILLGVARHLAAAAERPRIDTLLLFQPSEESGNGARAMLEEGVFAGRKVEAVFGMHGWPDLPLGKVGVHGGPVMASVDNFEIMVRGRGGHGAQPHHTLDPIHASAQLITALQSLVSRGTDPLEGAVLTIGNIQAGFTHNVIPEECLLKGTLRSHSDTVRRALMGRLDTLRQGLLGGLGLTSTLTWVEGCPATVNHPAMAIRAREAAERVLGKGGWVDPKPTMAAEDFSYFLQEAPGAYLWLGLGGERGSLHNPRFDFNDEAMETGIRLFVEILKGF